MSYYIQLPPDGVGKKVRHSQQVDVLMNPELVVAEIGSLVYGKTSLAVGTLKGISREDGWTTFHIQNVNGTFVVNEEITNGALVTYGVADLVYDDLFSPVVHVADRNQPSNTLAVSDKGAAFVTFPEGTPQFDAFGRMEVSQMQAVADYNFVLRDELGKYYSHILGSGSTIHNPNLSSLTLSVGTENNACARRTTNQYHPYKPGTSQLIYMTIACGDTGKENVVREWGYFDKYDGLGFRLNGTTLQVFQRNSVSGTVVETVVNQEDWNVNSLDTPIVSDFVLDVSKGNIYWIDFEWLGMGRVRFGVIAPDGRRITCHIFENANSSPYPYMQLGTLPLSWGIQNTGLSQSSSELRVTCATVFTETADLLYTGRLIHTSPLEPIEFSNSDHYKPFLNFKAKSTVNGLPNSIVGIHETFDWTSIGDSPIHIAIFVIPSESYLTGHRWTDKTAPDTMLWVDTDATSFPQYQVWNGASVNFTGSISGNTLTVTAVVNGELRKDQFIVGSGIVEHTKIIGYGTGTGGVGTYILNKSQTIASQAIQAFEPVRPIESFIAPTNSSDRTNLGDRIEKSFGLGGNLDVAEEDKPVFVFAAKVLKPATTVNLFYTKYWKEIK